MACGCVEMWRCWRSNVLRTSSTAQVSGSDWRVSHSAAASTTHWPWRQRRTRTPWQYMSEPSGRGLTTWGNSSTPNWSTTLLTPRHDWQLDLLQLHWYWTVMMRLLASIGVIYWGTRGTGISHFLGWGIPTFQDVKVKNLLSTEAICGGKITIKPFSAALSPGPRWESSRLSLRPQSRIRTDISILLPSRLETHSASFSFWIDWYPTFTPK